MVVWVQSNQALPFSEGHGQLYAAEVVLKMLEVVVVAASTYKELEVDVVVWVQSNQALPFSEGQEKLVGG